MVPISLPDDSPQLQSKYVYLTDREYQCSNQDPAGHKGSFGKAAIIAGSTGMTGAAHLASQQPSAAAGLVTLEFCLLNPIMEEKLRSNDLPLKDNNMGHLYPNL